VITVITGAVLAPAAYLTLLNLKLSPEGAALDTALLAVPHRSRWLSHGLIIPPLLRLAYFAIVLTLLFFGLAWGLARFGVIVPNYAEQAALYLLQLARTQPREVLLVLLGFVTGGAAHSIADWLVTDGKHVLHRLGVRTTRDYTGHDRWRPRRARHHFL
jgi:hypothetical protein